MTEASAVDITSEHREIQHSPLGGLLFMYGA